MLSTQQLFSETVQIVLVTVPVVFNTSHDHTAANSSGWIKWSAVPEHNIVIINMPGWPDQ